jgi:hypothetical protein
MDAERSTIALEQELARLLNDLAAIQHDLLAMLAESRNVAPVGGWSALSSFDSEERNLCDRLQACHPRYEQLLQAAAEQGLTADALERLASPRQAGRNDHLRPSVAAAAFERLLRNPSLADWPLAQRSLLQAWRVLETLAAAVPKSSQKST